MHKQDPVLIIGGGFIGTALASRFVREGIAVQMLARHKPLNPPEGVEIIEGDQSDGHIIQKLLATNKTIIHTACATTPGSSARHPSMEAELNIFPALRFLEHCQLSPPSQIIYISSGGTLYGNAGLAPVTEDCPPAPISYHGCGKLAVEAAMLAFGIASECTISILRPSNIYGPGQNLRAGFGVVRTLLECARNRQAMEIWGDGGSVRDYLFIDDLVDACWKIFLLCASSNIYNVGSSQGVSLMTLIELTQNIIGEHLEITRRPGRRSDVEAIVLDATRLKQATGWRPEYDIVSGLSRTWEWLKR